MAFLHHEEPYQNSPRPAFILLDLHLPRKDGRQVLTEIKNEENLRQIPVFILSTSTRAEDIDGAYDLHANCYIPKPVDLEKLVQVSRQIEAFWLDTVVLPA
jgi:CheY-like chemotaxis protein